MSKAPTLTARELLERLTDPKWWPNGNVDLDVEVVVAVYESDEVNGTASGVFNTGTNRVDPQGYILDEDADEGGDVKFVLNFFQEL
jgi:hypothetical protein